MDFTRKTRQTIMTKGKRNNELNKEVDFLKEM